MKRYRLAALGVVLAASSGALARPPAANTWFESPGDAGDLPGTSQDTNGVDPLQFIIGTLGAGTDVDMFRIRITNVEQFLAQANGNEGRGTGLVDSQLWLFDCKGRGVTADDDSGNGLHAFITGANVPAPGVYYLAISSFNVDAFDEFGNDLWDSSGNGPDAPPDSSNPLHHWMQDGDGDPVGGGAYHLTLRGAAFSNGAECCDVIPLPAAGLMGLAGLGVVGTLRRRAV